MDTPSGWALTLHERTRAADPNPWIRPITDICLAVCAEARRLPGGIFAPARANPECSALEVRLARIAGGAKARPEWIQASES